MGRRKKRHRGKEEVELNLAAMLDMAFQLLTFFILTFKPAPVEGDIALRMPPPQPITNPNGEAAGSNDKNTNPVSGLNSLIISAYPNKSGQVGTMAIGDSQVSLAQLDSRLVKILSDSGSPFEQVIIQAGSGLRYDALMNIIDICTRQHLPNGDKLKKLTFVEMPSDDK